MNNQYNVSLLIENGLLSTIYKEEIDQLKENFLANTNFSSVQEYTFKEQDKKLTIENFNKPENHLVFVLTGACSSLWKNNEVFNFVKNLESDAVVSVINVLPTRMWRGLGLYIDRDAKTVMPIGIKNNTQIEKELDVLNEQSYLDNSITLPTAPINKTEELLSTIMNGGKVNNFSLYRNNRQLDAENNNKSEIPPAHKVAMYRQMVSQDDYSLAVYFSTTKSFTISDIEFVRQHMLPSSDKSSVAAFLLGGILEKAPGMNNDQIAFEQTTLINENTPQAYSLTMSYSGPRTIPVEPEQCYQMKAGIAEELIKSLRYSEERAINILLHEKKNIDAMNDYANEVKAKPKM